MAAPKKAKKKTSTKKLSAPRKAVKKLAAPKKTAKLKKLAVPKSKKSSTKNQKRSSVIRRTSAKRVANKKVKEMTQDQVETALFGSSNSKWFFLSTGISLALMLSFIVSYSPSVSNFLKASIFEKPSLQQLSEVIPPQAEPLNILGTIITCSDATMCNHTDVHTVLKQIMPGLTFNQLDLSSPTAAKFISQYNISSFPAFILPESASKSDIWFAMKDFFTREGRHYVLKTSLLNAGDQWFAQKPAIPASATLIGSASAPLTIIEYSDYTNLQNRRYFLDAYNLLKAKYIDAGKVNYAIVETPSSNQESVFIAKAMQRIAQKAPGSYWAARREIMLNPSSESAKALLERLSLESSSVFGIKLSPEKQQAGTIIIGNKLLSTGVSLQNLQDTIEQELQR